MKALKILKDVIESDSAIYDKWRDSIASKEEILEAVAELEALQNHHGWEVCVNCEHRPKVGVCKYPDCVVKSHDYFKPKAQQ